jgi:hypothetical protein
MDNIAIVAPEMARCIYIYIYIYIYQSKRHDNVSHTHRNIYVEGDIRSLDRGMSRMTEGTRIVTAVKVGGLITFHVLSWS